MNISDFDMSFDRLVNARQDKKTWSIPQNAKKVKKSKCKMHFECEEQEPVMFVPEYTSGAVPLNSSRIMLVNKNHFQNNVFNPEKYFLRSKSFIIYLCIEFVNLDVWTRFLRPFSEV